MFERGVTGITSACAEQTRSFFSLLAIKRITSACAEQTYATILIFFNATDHLRVCGADVSARIVDEVLRGSPPRVRSRPAIVAEERVWVGITSACAEQTSFQVPRISSDRDHLRVCGADLYI